MEIKGHSAGLALAGVFMASILAMSLLLGLPIFGVSYSWGWGAIDHGTRTVKIVTPDITDIGTGDVFLVEGEELEVNYDLRLEQGRAHIAVLDFGWVSVIGDRQWFYMNADIRRPTRQQVRLTAPRNGFYRTSGTVVDGTGEFTVEWRVHSPQRRGQMMRLIGSARRWLGLAAIGVVILAVGAAVVNRRD